MDNNYFRIKYEKKDINFDIKSTQLQLWSADSFDETIGLYVEVDTRQIEIEIFDEHDKEPYRHYLSPSIYTEWLDIPVDYIKNRDFRTLGNVSIDFKDSGEMDEIERILMTEAPGALYVDSHEVFEKVKIDFKYLGQGYFNVKLNGITEYDIPFEVSANIPLEVVLKAYEKRATKEDILTFFDKIFEPKEFDQSWNYRDDDIFFKAIPKELIKLS